MTNEDHAPGVYEKQGQLRVADTKREAVALIFDGYVRVVDEKKKTTTRGSKAASTPKDKK